MYNGKAKTPTVTIKGLTKGKDYTVSYSSNKLVGTATVTVTGMGSCAGTATKTFTITPKKATVKSTSVLKKKRVKVTLSAKATKLAGTKYQISYKVKGAKKWKSVYTSNKTKVLKKLKKGKRYYVKARVYKKVNGKTYYGAWSKSKLTKKVK